MTRTVPADGEGQAGSPVPTRILTFRRTACIPWAPRHRRPAASAMPTPRSPTRSRPCAAAEAEACLGTDLAVYAGLFAIAFAAATLLPAQSEIALGMLLAAGEQPAGALLVVASIGNVGGASVNWLLGRGVSRFRDRRWFPVSARTLESAEAWYRRWGQWSLLLTWLPVVGDPLTVAAGVLREPFLPFLLLVTCGVVGRYLVVAAITLGFW
jgi:membrane protein YqaA with SNARE-associated domain